MVTRAIKTMNKMMTRTLYRIRNGTNFYTCMCTTSIRPFLVVFGSYKHNGDLLTSVVPGVETAAETMLDAYPVFYELIKQLANDRAADKNIVHLYLEVENVRGDIAAIAKDMTSSTDPIKMEIVEAMRNLPQYDLGPMQRFSYYDILSKILIAGTHIETLDAKGEVIFSENAKNMLQILKDALSDCRKEVSQDYGHKLKLADTLSKPNTDLMREVKALLDTNPFDRPQ